ncbi:hypothetical protein [Paracoccus sp. 22332]|uniref:hypothetical protein n=1 Tax=Paracoccus sp. 22332 TaxID=3453913 RepID=UPI003F8382C6
MSDKPAPSLPGDRISVLIVEDEMMIALDVQMMLEDNGYAVLGPVGSVEGALRLLDDTRPDVAVLDEKGAFVGQGAGSVALPGRGVFCLVAAAYDR